MPNGVDFANSLAVEIAALAELAPHRHVTSVFFGGGTPSLMPPLAVEKVLAAIGRLWTLDNDAEITLEANPTSTETQNFRGYRAAGVNRLSVGVQAMNDRDLQLLGRQHSAAEALVAFRLAAAIFPRVSFDLIYARPGQSPDLWRTELLAALKEQQGHMSLYQLTLEPGTRFWELYNRGSLVLPSEDDCAAMFELTQELTQDAGLQAYEVSNHASPGQESRHNLLYWRYGEYAGAGPGAHSRIMCNDGRRVAIANELHPEKWQARVTEVGHGQVEKTYLEPQEEALELLLMGMRLSEGIMTDRYAQLAGSAFSSDVLSELSKEGLIELDSSNKTLKATLKGRNVLNALIRALVGASRPSRRAAAKS